MLEWFKCPDGEIIPYKTCLEKCPKPERCQPMSYLHLCAEEREWTGEPSTTQLLNGTMHSFLKLTMPYAIDPDDKAFMIDGTKTHEQLEIKAKQFGIPAEVSTTGDGRNAIDALEYENGIITLIDHKRWGSFRVAKALGMIEVGKKPDPSGAVYQRSGAWGKAGTPKMVSVFQEVATEADNLETELQLNRYCIMIEDLGIPINKMKVHIMVRDGGLQVSRGRGITRNTYLIPIKRMDKSIVEKYFRDKREELLKALDTKAWSIPCDNRESWDGVRCRDYCEVWTYCPKGLIEHG